MMVEKNRHSAKGSPRAGYAGWGTGRGGRESVWDGLCSAVQCSAVQFWLALAICSLGAAGRPVWAVFFWVDGGRWACRVGEGLKKKNEKAGSGEARGERPLAAERRRRRRRLRAAREKRRRTRSSEARPKLQQDVASKKNMTRNI